MELDEAESRSLEGEPAVSLHPFVVGVESLVDDLLPEQRVLQLLVGDNIINIIILLIHYSNL